MTLFSEQLEKRRNRNARGLAAFGVNPADSPASVEKYRVIRDGSGPTLFTIGYERRNGEELVSMLRDAGVEVLADVRQRPMSRRPDFRGAALRQRCEDAGIAYLAMPDLGSTSSLREDLSATGDIKTFQKRYRAHARRHQLEPLGRLAEVIAEQSVALICFERRHEECHRATIADLVAEDLNARVVAL